MNYGTGCASTVQQRVRAGLVGPAFSLGADTVACEGEPVLLRGPALSQPGAGLPLVRRLGGAHAARDAGRHVQPAAQRRMPPATPSAGRVDFRSCLTIPNVFTPNEDGRNDRFEIRGIAGSSWALQVYSRWGQKLFDTAAYQNNWGREAAPGVYYYVLSNPANPASPYKGWVEVIR